MAGNSDPIVSKVAEQSGALVVTAASALYDPSGTFGTDLYKVWTSDATNGGWLEELIMGYGGSATTVSNAAIMRFWLSSVGSGSAPTIGTQAWLLPFMQVLPAVTPSTTVPNPVIVRPVRRMYAPGMFVLAKISVSQPANMGWLTSGHGGKY